MKKIDVIDAKILKSLLRDSRTSFTQMAKDCKVSATAIRRRYYRLKEDAIITGEFVYVDLRRFGYDYIAEIGIKTPVSQEEEVKKGLTTMPYIIAAEIGTQTFGKYNIVALAALPNMTSLTNVIKEIANKPSVKNVEILGWNGSQGTYDLEDLDIYPIFGENKKTKIETPSRIKQIPEAGLKKVQLDDIDKQIISILFKKSRTPFNNIAEQTGISIKNVRKRYRKLVEGKVIIKSAITVNLKKLGYKCIAFVFVKLENINMLEKVQEKLIQIPNQIMFTCYTGAYDIRCVYVLRDIEELLKLGKQIRKIDGIEEAQIFPNDTYLESFPPFIPLKSPL